MCIFVQSVKLHNFLIGGTWKSNVVLDKFLKSPEKMVAFFCMNPGSFPTYVYDLTYDGITIYSACKFTPWAICTMDVALYDWLAFPPMGCKIIWLLKLQI